jgi:hypothetical protein
MRREIKQDLDIHFVIGADLGFAVPTQITPRTITHRIRHDFIKRINNTAHCLYGFCSGPTPETTKKPAEVFSLSADLYGAGLSENAPPI